MTLLRVQSTNWEWYKASLDVFEVETNLVINHQQIVSLFRFVHKYMLKLLLCPQYKGRKYFMFIGQKNKNKNQALFLRVFP